MSHKIIRLPEVKEMVGLSRPSIYKRMAIGDFPPAISLGGRAVGWLQSDIELWLDKRIAVSKGADND
ncbi:MULTISPECIES: helix-turn-helix transcriptional regulator [Shewanella]|uniref:AlpA family transcriptional regulator n=1 Tax=Shewanella marisflavi TaxID=260364 RepID=A0ABX5WQE6_9GAMM|nr:MULTISPECIES: AlpA family transcriptional regulator [Shewanella]KIO36322.1 AlpA family transcriptional regulator [Shewanella sp. cp20]QDF75995.1 AlpA family transcriptional regulator [Shewanella marisflavi]